MLQGGKNRVSLIFGSVIWHPHHQVRIDRIESIQKKFVFVLFRKFGWYHYIKFAPYLCKLKLLVLASRRWGNSCIFFIFDLMREHISSDRLWGLLSQMCQNCDNFDFNIFLTTHQVRQSSIISYAYPTLEKWVWIISVCLKNSQKADKNQSG